jgi:NADPH-dependent 2,4-dienoyl-CoA reductase/sulfur reductase-like enzyme/peroxiredoxin family protein/rhodanese-related sulfurtransferase/TusA-related sulfurtransferase
VRVFDVAKGTEYEERYDKLVVCPGAAPIRPKLPGVDHPRVLVLRNVDDMDRIKAVVDGGAKSAVVIGGGYIGVEMAENLCARGLAVDVVELVDQLMPPLDREMARDLETHLRLHGVGLHLGTAAAAFRDDGGRVRVELTNTEVLTADLAVLSVGVRPESTLAREAGLTLGPRGGIQVDAHMRTSDPDIYAAGDAVEVKDLVSGEPALIPLAGPANRQGRIVAENLCGRDTAYTATQGTAVVKVFDMTAGVTGASEKTLKRLGRPYRKVYLHPSGHAGYYPGSAPMHIKLLFTPDTGKLLGAQVVGFDGVDKRLDVFATALRAGLTVHDLQALELSYAPPYGSAKDPVNMAGFVASNLLRGEVEFWYAEEYPAGGEGAVIVDVRGPAEYETWHIPGALNIPLGKLRAQAEKLPKDKPVLVYCKVGFRSYLAYRLLKQRGVARVRTLAGGSLTFCSVHDAAKLEGAGKPQPATLSYAEEPRAKPAEAAAAPVATGKLVEVECSGLQCPGPIQRLQEAMDGLQPGDEVRVRATDLGFASDVEAWSRRQGHAVLSVKSEGGRVLAHVRKGVPVAAAMGPAAPALDGKTMVVFSGELDKVLAAFIIANGAAAMGNRVTMFFTFWGLNALRKEQPPSVKKTLISRMLGAMMPRGAERLALSKMDMLGAGRALMKHVMKSKNVASLPELMASAQKAGVKIVACTMSMDVLGIAREELIGGLEYGGVAAFLGETDRSSATLFI